MTIRKTPLRHYDLEGQHVIGVVPDRHAGQQHEAADEQTSAHQQHRRQRDLGHDQHAFRQVLTAEAEAGRHRRGRVLDHVHRIDLREMRQRRQAAEKSRCKRRPCGEQQHPQIDGHLIDTRQDGGGACREPPRRIDHRKRLEERDAAVSDDNRGQSAGGGEHERFGQHLASEPATAATERGANRDFPLSIAAAREQQIGDVGAGDQQHEDDGSEEDEQRRPHRRDQLIVHASHRKSLQLGISGRTAPQLCPDHIRLGRGGLQ